MDNNLHSSLRIIKTARTEYAINVAAAKGFWPLVKPVIPSPEIRSKYAVLQDSKTGQIKVIGDYRLGNQNAKGEPMTEVIGFTYYYPYSFESPFAAYLVPSDIQIGENVMIEDLIEDIIGSTWNQGDNYRLKSCEAVWDGKDFIISTDKISRLKMIG